MRMMQEGLSVWFADLKSQLVRFSAIAAALAVAPWVLHNATAMWARR